MLQLKLRINCFVWLLDKLIPTLDPWIQEPLGRLRGLVVQRMSEVVYPGSVLLRAPIVSETLDVFSLGMQRFIAQRDAPFDLEFELEKLNDGI